MIKQLKKIFARELPFAALMPALLWTVLFLCIPLAIILYFSFAKQVGTWHMTIDYYKMLFSSISVRVIGRSLMLAISTSATCLLVSYPIAYFLALYVYRFKGLLLFLLTLPFWTNFLVQIYAWFFLLERDGLINSLLLKLHIITDPLPLSNNVFAIFIVMVYCYLPFMIMPLYSVLEKLNIDLLEASLDLGASQWQTFMRVTLPLSLPGIKTGILLVMIPCFGEFAIPALMGGAKNMTVGTLISYYFLIARNNSLGAAFTCLAGLVLLISVLLFHWCIRRFYWSAKGVRLL